MKKLLNGEWEFKNVNDGDWLPANVPGCHYLDLLALDMIPDPFYGTNEKDVYWVALADWEYSRVFDVSEDELCCDKILLSCDMLDTICEVFINEKPVGRGENCHAKYSFDVKSVLDSGENTVRIVFRSPVNYVKEKYALEKTPKNMNGQSGITHIRKPQCHFGWDWGPVLPPSGITRDIYLEFIKTAKIDDVQISQSHENGKVMVRVCADIETFNDSDIDCIISLAGPDGAVTEQKNGPECSFLVENPELWWTAELSEKDEQPLYAVNARISDKNGLIDENTKKIGLRTIELNRGRDEYGSNFQFVLNGVPMFIKGANWIPADSFITRFDSEKLKYALDAARFSNMNMLRIWGGGYYESDEMYEECDRRGILLWQDFGFACQPYPFFDGGFLENVKREIEYNVKRLRHHACLAIWCGNNEIEAMSTLWKFNIKYVKWTEKFFYGILEPEIRKYDGATPYIPGSPCGMAHNKGVGKDNVGDTHLWAVWHGLQPMDYYRKRFTRFCSEFGFESLPDIKTIERFAEPGDYSLDSEVFTAHQKCWSGNRKMVYYIAPRFLLPENFEDFIYLSQIAQMECVSDATEHWRRNKGRCNGSMYWQMNDCWPVCSWAGMDYYGNYKALQYAARRFNAPLSVSIQDGRYKTKIFVLNDTDKEQKARVEYKIFDFEKGVLKEDGFWLKIAPVKNKAAYVFEMEKFVRGFDLKRTGIIAQLIQNGEIISEKTALFYKEKELNLPKANLKHEICINNEKLEITVETDSFARLVRIESLLSPLPFSDNYFDLLPGGRKTVAMPLDGKFAPGEQAESIRVFSCSDVKPGKSEFLGKIERAKIFFAPMNFGGWIVYKQSPRDFNLKAFDSKAKKH
ncbi:MAG: hypothetical protein FWF08_06690 [Oscillospiraceae bacterium]|nr:hypothetical protein [Oscillospiraceae bacterium]